MTKRWELSYSDVFNMFPKMSLYVSPKIFGLYAGVFFKNYSDVFQKRHNTLLIMANLKMSLKKNAA